MIRQSHLIAVVGTFLMGCTVLLFVGCAGVRPEASEKEQGHTQATKQEQERSPEATASGEARCGGTGTVDLQGRTYTTNDVSGCPQGGLLSGTDGRDKLDGGYGDDEIRGLGGVDAIFGGLGSDVIYGGDGNDSIDGATVDFTGHVVRNQRDELYCGEGKDHYTADKLDYVDSTCEVKDPPPNM